ncbi:methionine biosynthesis protein MetW [Isoalcanivorax beigongshangi]|uniref:Methionine biosynthesis protein MetW n=1 Tax=Isoalcanivorax beigongshangi TaxID=3238810 RepID=A0ABV4AF98_9GAMM
MVRPDLALLAEWIPQGARVLDLGCGDGSLLAYLKEARGIQGYGLEIDPDNIARCLDNGVNVIEQDLDQGLGNFADQRFDYVVMTQAIQALERPDGLLAEMLRVGREAIVTFPNFGYWRVRQYLLARGRMPVSRRLPYQWYDTPNIHLCTVRDFEALCHEHGHRIQERKVLNHDLQQTWPSQVWPNLFGELALYRLSH